MTQSFVRKVFLGGVVACLASAPAILWAELLYSENWESGSIDAADWTKWGYPDSVLQSGGNVIGNHSLDPNGDSSYLSGLVSTNTLTLSAGLRLSVDAYIEAASSWSELSFGLANTTAVTPTNVHLTHLAAITIDADTQGSASPPEDNYKFYTKFQGSGGSQTVYPSVASGLTPTSVFDGWHSYTYDFMQNGSAQVLVDDVLAFETAAGLFDYGVDNSFALVFSGRSYSSTVNLYDSISVYQVPEAAALPLLLLGSLTLLLFRCRR